ncbi:flagellar basal-body rod protein FlgB [Chromatiales bacterium (ex Bugula neritina AB1)]|nr:flagellar basal-body rod protein FlgB [Chromatiales bacterium (ex Bugula neritina AB1)]
MSFNLDTYLGVHTKAVELRQYKAGLMATNLANADTPGYKARDINFAETLQAVSSTGGGKGRPFSFDRTHSSHMDSFDSAVDFSPEVQALYRVPTQPSLDGNTVQTDVEQSLFTKNAINYQASLQLLNSRITGLIKTLKGE